MKQFAISHLYHEYYEGFYYEHIEPEFVVHTDDSD